MDESIEGHSGKPFRMVVEEGKRGGTMTFVEVVTEYRDMAGTVVAESRSTVIETSQAPGS